jgi:hypothetical protein
MRLSNNVILEGVLPLLGRTTEESVHGESVHLYLQSECKQDESAIHSWGRILLLPFGKDQNDNSGLFGQPDKE